MCFQNSSAVLNDEKSGPSAAESERVRGRKMAGKRRRVVMRTRFMNVAGRGILASTSLETIAAVISVAPRRSATRRPQSVLGRCVFPQDFCYGGVIRLTVWFTHQAFDPQH